MAETSGVAAGSLPHAGAPGAADPDLPMLAGLATFTMSAGGQLISWSVAARQLFGRTSKQAVGSHITALLAPGQGDAFAGALAAVAAGRSWAGAVAVAGPDGRQAVALRWDLLQGADGPPQVAVVTQRLAPAGHGVLAGAVARLGASLDLAETVRQVLDLAIPRLADVGSVYLLEPLLAGGRSETAGAGGAAAARRLAVHTADDSHHLWRSLLPDGEVVVFARGTPVARALATGRPVLFDQPDAGMRERASRYPGGDLARYGCFLAAPLTARGEVAGLLLLARGRGAPGFGARDVAAAQALAAEAGVCVDNARLYTQERRTAEALQQGLLPQRMTTPAGLDVAHRYRPAGDQAIGGDWLDIIALPGGRATVTVGDAMGHGPEAAAVMAQLRAATHALADLGLPPGELLHRLNRLALTVTEGTIATCVSATIDPGSGSCLIARAGHLPPVLALPGGSCEVIELPSGLPLGLGPATFEAVRLDLPPGAVLALYTDGLVENRARPFDVGIRALQAALSGVRGPLPPVCEAAVSELSRHGEDDTTLVLVRVPGGAAGGGGD